MSTNVNDYNYILPQESIANFPPEIRGKSRLLVLHKDSGSIEFKNYEDIIHYLNPGDILILNDTKVIKARLTARKETGGKVELFILEKHPEREEELVIFHGKIKDGEVLYIDNYKLKVEKIYQNGTAAITSDTDLYEIASKFGEVPLPPYINRKSTTDDENRYRTVFAKNPGSVAAPTASLNFTDELKNKIIKKGVNVEYITLHVGLGTFRAIIADDLKNHKMHEEYYEIKSSVVDKIRKAKKSGNKVVALGTTVTRAIEHASEKVLNLEYRSDITDEADIFIYPGYDFKIIDQLITNFHAPRSTVLMLTAAFATWPILHNAYQKAIERDFRFLSYGDSMMIVE